MATRRSHDEWWSTLSAPGAKLTLEEFRALEAASAHMLLERLVIGFGMATLNENGTGGYVEQIRNLSQSTRDLLERLAQRILGLTPEAPPALSNGRH